MFCVKCQEDIPASNIITHLRNYHEGEKDLDVQCPSCELHFQTRPCFQKHWYKKHYVRKPVSTATGDEPPSKRQQTESVESEEPTTSHAHPASSTGRDNYGPNLCENEVSGGVSCVESEIVVTASAECDAGLRQATVETRSAVTSEPSIVNESRNICMEGREIGSEDSDERLEDSDSSSDEWEDDSEEETDSGVAIEKTTAPSVLLKVKDVSTSVPVNSKAGQFVLKLRGVCNSMGAVKEVMQMTENLITASLVECYSEIEQKLKSKNIHLSEVVHVEEVIKSKVSIFDNLKTKKQQDKHFEKELKVLTPQAIPLGHEFKKIRKKGSNIMHIKRVPQNLYYVPVEKVVEKLISHPDYEKFVEEGRQCNSKHLDAYMKGERCKHNSVLKGHPDALRFVLYYDDVEVCSPLKSRSGKHKLGAFYLFLDNIPRKYRSNLSMICLVALVNANLVKGKSYGMDAALEEIVKVLKQFEQGVVIGGKMIYGTLIAVIGDNLGLHGIGGFKEGFTANRPCRFCLATLSQVQTMVAEDKEILRDPETHEVHCSEVQTVRGKNEKKSTLYGVNRNSILNDLQSFHVVTGLPPDAMHDVLEGVLPYTLKKMLHHFLYVPQGQKPLFTLQWLNQAIRDFDFEYMEITDRPSELKSDYITSNDTALHQSACQTWFLGTILPLIIGPLIDREDKYYENFLDCLLVCRLIFTSEVSPWMLTYMRDAIETYLITFKELYGNHLIPKQHHLVHYPDVILQMGSVVNYLCLRCEAKHKYFKHLVVTLNSEL